MTPSPVTSERPDIPPIGATPAMVSIDSSILDAAIDATAGTTVPPDLLLAIAWRESRLGKNPHCRQPGATSTGILQWNAASWIEAMEHFGARHGKARLAEDLDSRVPRIRQRSTRYALTLRTNTRLAFALLVDVLLERAPEDSAAAYFRHELGGTGERRLREAAEHGAANACDLVAKAACRANPAVFRGTARHAWAVMNAKVEFDRDRFRNMVEPDVPDIEVAMITLRTER